MAEGVCFVEFAVSDGMVKSLSLTGQNIKGARIEVQQSRAAQGAQSYSAKEVGSRSDWRSIAA